MKVYVVDFQYYNKDNGKESAITDRWILACKDIIDLERTMKANFDEFIIYGHEPIGYSFMELKTTDNGYKIIAV